MGKLRSGERPWLFLVPPSQEREKRLLAFSCILLLLVYLLHEECGHGLETHSTILLQGFGQEEALEMGGEVGYKVEQRSVDRIAGLWAHCLRDRQPLKTQVFSGVLCIQFFCAGLQCWGSDSGP